jgi:hypothetical protein
MTRSGNQVRVLDRHTRRPSGAGRADQHFSWSEGVWACQDLNLGPHPYQLNAGNRCAHRRFCRSPPTVGAKGMRSIGAQVCVLSVPPSTLTPSVREHFCALWRRRGSAAITGGGADAAEWLPRQAGDKISASSWLQIMLRSGRLAASTGWVMSLRGPSWSWLGGDPQDPQAGVHVAGQH